VRVRWRKIHFNTSSPIVLSCSFTSFRMLDGVIRCRDSRPVESRQKQNGFWLRRMVADRWHRARAGLPLALFFSRCNTTPPSQYQAGCIVPEAERWRRSGSRPVASYKNSMVASCLGFCLRRMGQNGGIVPDQSSPCTHHVPRHPSIYFPRLRDVARLTPPDSTTSEARPGEWSALRI